MDISEIVKNIQYLLAPAVMVSSSALLLLGFNNKFSNLASRFRTLNQEKRQLLIKASRNEQKESRLKILLAQVDHLMLRATKVKNAVVACYAAIACFTGTSFLLFLNVYASFHLWSLIIGVFLAGMSCVFLSALWMIQETGLFYKVIAIESRS